MTTWERATESDLNDIRVLLRKIRSAGQVPPRTEAQLAGLTKRQAGELKTQLREMLRETDR